MAAETTPMTTIGDCLRATREHQGLTLERAAELSGISISHLSRLVSSERQPSVASLLALSAAFTAIAGSLYVTKTGFIDPDSGFGILISVQMVIVAALGGAGTLFGPLLGALILIPLQTATNTWFGGGGSGLTYILYGGIIVVIARFEPGGLFELWHRLAPRLRKRAHAA